jgi:hypothetical protein
MSDQVPYWQKLQDPRWQRKRLEIMQRADFRCECCGEDAETLNVHHGYYEKGKQPWEYESETLWCLCVHCHETNQQHLTEAQRQLAQMHPSFLDYATALLEWAKRQNPPELEAILDLVAAEGSHGR